MNTKPETFHERLNRLVYESPQKPQALSKAAGLDKETLRKLLGNENQQPSAKTLQGLARVLGVSVQYLLTGDTTANHIRPFVDSYDPDSADNGMDLSVAEHDQLMSRGTETGSRNIPAGHSAQIDVTAGMGSGGLTTVVEGVPGKGGLTFAADQVRDHWRLPGEVLSSLALNASSIAIFPVQGDSMLPTLNEGDYVFVDTRHRFPSPDGIYALADSFGGIIVKRLEVTSRPGDENPEVRIISDNHERHPARVWRLDDMQIIGRVVRRFGVVR